MSRFAAQLGLMIFLFCPIAEGAVRLPRLVSDHMVLQRNQPLPIWGWANPGEAVNITFNGQRLSTKTDANGQWRATLSPLSAGGPFSMTVSGSNTIVIQDILIGDVWLGSGQSNMEWRLRQNINNAEQEIKTANFPQIRLFDVKDSVAILPRTEVKSTGWQLCTPETVADFSAVAYFFGRQLHQRYNVPIGLITSDWGGTPIEAWMSLPSLKTFPELGPKVAALEDNPSGDPARLKIAFGKHLADWQATYTSADKGYQSGVPVWASETLNTTDWPTMNLPTIWEKPDLLPGFDGVVWFRKQLDIDAADAGKPILLQLGRIDDLDSTWFNGEKIGGSSPWNSLRSYTVPGRLVKAGRNTIAIRVLDTGSDGGIRGAPEELAAIIGNKTTPLTDSWRYQVGISTSDAPPAPGLIFSQNSFGSLFNAMIAPLIPYGIKGVIWYQGEANVAKAHQYGQLFPGMIRDWRNRWGYEFPFLFAQLSAFMHDKDEPADYPWAELREAQAMTTTLAKTGMAVTIDIGDPNNIHPGNKQDVGKRLALVAQRLAYDEPVRDKGPTYQSMTVQGNQVRLTFSHADDGLIIRDKYGYVRGFAVAGADRRFRWAAGRREGNEIVLTTDGVDKPVAVRYNWGNSPDGNVFNRDGLPAVPFRTDNWPGLTFGKK